MKRNVQLLFYALLISLSALILGCYTPSEPYLGAAGIGVSDLAVSSDFYTRVLGMKVKQKFRFCGREEVVLEFADSKGADLVLVNYTDGSTPNYKNNPVKIVFYVPNAVAFALAIKNEGLTIVSWPVPLPQFGGIKVGFAKDPDGYLIEIVEDTTVTVPYIGAAGIGVSDLDAAVDFYTRVIGLKEMSRLSLGYMVESILEFEQRKGAATVLMHYTAPKNYTDLPVKLVYYVEDPFSMFKVFRDEGLEIIVKPKKRFDIFNFGVAKDADGYILEVHQSYEETESEE